MVEYHPAALNTVFRALSDPTRRAMLARLATGERSVSDLAEPFQMSLAAASKHIRILERAGLMERTVAGRTHFCRLDADPLAAADDWLRTYRIFWSERLDALAVALSRADVKLPQGDRHE